MFLVDLIGCSGGLALFWKEKNQVTLIGYSRNHIDVQVQVEDTSLWRPTGLYGEPNSSQRRKT